MTLNQIVSDIRNIATSGSNPIDFRIEDKQIEFWVHEVRSMLISQAIQKRQDISDIWVQTIWCLELEQVDSSECCDVTTGCYVLRSKQKLPRTIEVTGDNSILRVSTPTGKLIPKSNPFESRYNKYSKYTKVSARWYVKNDYLYIENEVYLKYVNVDLLVENPEDLALFNDCNGDNCFDIDSQYPCSLKMANDITNIVFKTKVYPFMNMPQDNTNNATNDSQGNPNIKNV